MIIVVTEEKYNLMREQTKEPADLIVVLKDDRTAWVAKNRFGNQRELSVHNVPAFVSSFMQVLGF